MQFYKLIDLSIVKIILRKIIKNTFHENNCNFDYQENKRSLQRY